MAKQRSEEKRQRTTDRQVSAVKRHEWAVRTTERQGVSVAKRNSAAVPKNSLPITMPGTSIRGNLTALVNSTESKSARSRADFMDASQTFEAARREYERMYSKQMVRDEGAAYNTYLDGIAWRKGMVTFFGGVLFGALVLFVAAANHWIPSSAYSVGGALAVLLGCITMLGAATLRDRRRQQAIRAIMEMNKQSKQTQS